MFIGWKAAGSDRKIASLRYRVEAPVRALQARGHQVEIFDPRHERRYDCVVFAKAYKAEDRALAAAVRSRGGRVVFDLCDNHFHNPDDLPKYRQAREDLLDMLSVSQAIVCATPTLATAVREEAPWAAEPFVIGDPVERLPTAAASLPPFDGLRLLWFGSHGSPNAPSGMCDILLIEQHLEAVAKTHPVELVVCSNDLAKFERLIAPLPFATRYVDWTLEGFPGVLASADGVVIPISRNPFTACKTHNRLTTALYAGTPVIADRIGDYEIFEAYCTLDDWAGGLRRLIDLPAAERAKAAGARDVLDRCWTASALSPRWEAVLGLSEMAAGQPEPVAAPPEIAPSPVLELACQGALDGRAEGAVSGWVRCPQMPARSLTVRLERNGVTVATAKADQLRADLERAGMPDPSCGFVLAMPAEETGGLFEVVVEETGWRFDTPAFGVRPDARGARLVFGAGGRLNGGPSPAGFDGGLSRTPDAVSLKQANAVQQALLAELENLAAMMTEARDAAARLILAVGDDASLARRVLSVLSGRGKPDRIGRRSQEDEKPGARLN